MHGMANGLIFAQSVLKSNGNPDYLEKPKRYIVQKTIFQKVRAFLNPKNL